MKTERSLVGCCYVCLRPATSGHTSAAPFHRHSSAAPSRHSSPFMGRTSSSDRQLQVQPPKMATTTQLNETMSSLHLSPAAPAVATKVEAASTSSGNGSGLSRLEMLRERQRKLRSSYQTQIAVSRKSLSVAVASSSTASGKETTGSVPDASESTPKSSTDATLDDYKRQIAELKADRQLLLNKQSERLESACQQLNEMEELIKQYEDYGQETQEHNVVLHAQLALQKSETQRLQDELQGKERVLEKQQQRLLASCDQMTELEEQLLQLTEDLAYSEQRNQTLEQQLKQLLIEKHKREEMDKLQVTSSGSEAPQHQQQSKQLMTLQEEAELERSKRRKQHEQQGRMYANDQQKSEEKDKPSATLADADTHVLQRPKEPMTPQEEAELARSKRRKQQQNQEEDKHPNHDLLIEMQKSDEKDEPSASPAEGETQQQQSKKPTTLQEQAELVRSKRRKQQQREGFQYPNNHHGGRHNHYQQQQVGPRFQINGGKQPIQESQSAMNDNASQSSQRSRNKRNKRNRRR